MLLVAETLRFGMTITQFMGKIKLLKTLAGCANLSGHTYGSVFAVAVAIAVILWDPEENYLSPVRREAFPKSDPEFYTEEIIKGLVLVMLLAGTDTSSSTMEWALSLLLNNREAMKKARAEIDEHVGHNRLIEESDLNNLPYLHNIILETLRIRPVSPLVIHHSSEECTVGGYRVPRDTILMVNVWALHHDPEVWEEPEKFRPERFEGWQRNRAGFKWMPFGFGRRACPGEGLAMRVVGLALGSLIQCFEWERLGEELVDLEENAGLTAPKVKPLVAKCMPRKEIKFMY